MSKSSRPDPKSKALREQGCLNPRPDKVQDPLFRDSDFFDARDIVQVKYEMLRRVDADDRSVTEAATSFGLSRPSFYQARESFAREGLAGLVPKKRGPRGGHKLTEEIAVFIEQARADEARPGAHRLAELVRERFNVSLHPRTIERATRRREKKRR